eukprot:3062634-Amphidinium_carterae.3
MAMGSEGAQPDCATARSESKGDLLGSHLRGAGVSKGSIKDPDVVEEWHSLFDEQVERALSQALVQIRNEHRKLLSSLKVPPSNRTVANSIAVNFGESPNSTNRTPPSRKLKLVGEHVEIHELDSSHPSGEVQRFADFESEVALKTNLVFTRTTTQVDDQAKSKKNRMQKAVTRGFAISSLTRTISSPEGNASRGDKEGRRCDCCVAVGTSRGAQKREGPWNAHRSDNSPRSRSTWRPYILVECPGAEFLSRLRVGGNANRLSTDDDVWHACCCAGTRRLSWVHDEDVYSEDFAGNGEGGAAEISRRTRPAE